MGGHCHSIFNVKVITKAKGYEGVKIFEVTTEGDKAISNLDQSRLRKLDIEEAFRFTSCSCIFFIVHVSICDDTLMFIFEGTVKVSIPLLESREV